MNIGIIITDITRRAGTERAVSNLSNILANHNNSVYIISIDSDSGNGAYELINGVSILHLNIGLSAADVIKKIQCYKQLLIAINKIIKEQELEYIIGTYSSINVLLPLFNKKVKTIGCEHFNYASANKLHNFLRFVLYRKLDAVVVLTPQDSKHYSFINRNRLFIIPNSLSFEIMNSHDYNQKCVISIGRLSYQKGFDILIDVVSRIARKIEDWKFIIVGDGEQKQCLLQKIKSKELDQIITIIPPTDSIITLYQAASIFLMTSRWEGLPMVLLEAQACGLPIISFDCPEGPASVIHDDKDGYLIRPFDIEIMANKLLTLIENRNLREKFGKRAFDSALTYSSENIYNLWYALFEEINI